MNVNFPNTPFFRLLQLSIAGYLAMRQSTWFFSICRRFSSSGAAERVRAIDSRSNPAKKYDAIVIGGGHNGLTAAAYLARSGLSVAVLERRHLVGGAAVTEEIVPGFRFSRCSYLQSLLRPSVIRELELQRHGLKLLRRSSSSFTPCLDGRSLLLGPDVELNCLEISKFSKKDAMAYPRYEDQLLKFCKFMDSLLDSLTPEVRRGLPSLMAQVKDKFDKSAFWSHLVHQAFALGQKDMLDFIDLLVSPAAKVLNNWFETEVLKATLATDAVIGSKLSASLLPDAHSNGFLFEINQVWKLCIDMMKQLFTRQAQDMSCFIM